MALWLHAVGLGREGGSYHCWGVLSDIVCVAAQLTACLQSAWWSGAFMGGGCMAPPPIRAEPDAC